MPWPQRETNPECYFLQVTLIREVISWRLFQICYFFMISVALQECYAGCWGWMPPLTPCQARTKQNEENALLWREPMRKQSDFYMPATRTHHVYQKSLHDTRCFLFYEINAWNLFASYVTWSFPNLKPWFLKSVMIDLHFIWLYARYCPH